MIIEVCLIIITAFIGLLFIVALVLAILLAKNLKTLKTTVSNVEFKLETALDEVTTTLCQATTTLTSLNELSISLKGKVDATDPLFHSISRVGTITESFLSSAKDLKLPKFASFTSPPKEKFDIADLAEWAGLGLMLWQKIKKKV